MSKRAEIKGKYPYNMICDIAGIGYTENINSDNIDRFMFLLNSEDGNNADIVKYLYSFPSESISNIAKRFNIPLHRIYMAKNNVFIKFKFFAILAIYSGRERLSKVLYMPIKDVFSYTGRQDAPYLNMPVKDYLAVPVNLLENRGDRFILHSRLRMIGIRSDFEGNRLPLFTSNFDDARSIYPNNYLYSVLDYLKAQYSYWIEIKHGLVENKFDYIKNKKVLGNIIRFVINTLYTTRDFVCSSTWRSKLLDVMVYRYAMRMTFEEVNKALQLETSLNRLMQINEEYLLRKLSRVLSRNLNDIVDTTLRGEIIKMADPKLEPLADFTSQQSLASTLYISHSIYSKLGCVSIKDILNMSNSKIEERLPLVSDRSNLYYALELAGYTRFNSGELFLIEELCPDQVALIKAMQSMVSF